MTLLDATGLRKSYGGHEVLKGVDLKVRRGETVAILGPNGAGKTTLFRVLTGEVASSAGRVVFDGVDLTRAAAHERVRRGFGRTFQVARLFLDMTAIENVVAAVEARRRFAGEPVGGRLAWRPSRAVAAEAVDILEQLGLGPRREDAAGILSHGDRKRLEFAVMLALRPRILMLDEPTAGMSPSDRAATAALIRRIRAERDLTVVMTEHDMDVIFGLADRIVVMNYGEVIADGDPLAVRADPTVRAVYLGSDAARA